MSLKKPLDELDAKIKALNLRLKKTAVVIEKNDKQAIERQRSAITNLTETIDQLRGSIQELKFAQGETEENIEEWSDQIELEITNADRSCERLSKRLEEMKFEEDARHHENAMLLEKQILAQKLEAVLKQKEIADKSSPAAKLPKVSITKFNGTSLDWVRFEGQFNAMLDSQDVHAVTKFSHLKELVEPRIRNALDCLPFTAEGYVRAWKYLKDKYGHPNEVAGAYVINLLELAPITERDVAKIHKFYESLLFNVESLMTLGKLDTIQGAAFFVIVRKLELLKSELVTNVEGDWRDWTFTKLLETLRKWTETNAVVKVDKRGKEKRNFSLPQDRAFQSNNGDGFKYTHGPNKCVYCDSNGHRAPNCDKVSSPNERKKILVERKLCFNCAAGQHSAKISKICNKRHHTSICQTPEEPVGMTVNVGKAAVVHSVVIVEIGGRKFRALLDSGASHSYVSSTLVDLTRARAARRSTRRIATLMGVTTAKLQEYDFCLRALKGNFTLNVRATGINKKELLTPQRREDRELPAFTWHRIGRSSYQRAAGGSCHFRSQRIRENPHSCSTAYWTVWRAGG